MHKILIATLLSTMFLFAAAGLSGCESDFDAGYDAENGLEAPDSMENAAFSACSASQWTTCENTCISDGWDADDAKCRVNDGDYQCFCGRIWGGGGGGPPSGDICFFNSSGNYVCGPAY